MFKKIQLVRVSIAIAIGSLAAGVVPVRSQSVSNGESTPISTQSLQSPSPQLIAGEPSKTRRYGKGQVVLDADGETVSGASEIALVEHLVKSGAKFYGAYWCSHCNKQKSMFGSVAAAKLPYIECAKDGENSQRQLCKDLAIRMFPTWSINGKMFEGTRELKDIAERSGYQGPMNFKYHK
jgi:thiol-disulfide isomerase/thioredoxin